MPRTPEQVRARTPIDAMLDTVDFRCAKCDAKMGTCDCWVACRCGMTYERGAECRNPVHAEEATAALLAAGVARAVILGVRLMYPEPMKHASGGFRKTLEHAITREVRETILAVMKSYERDETRKGSEPNGRDRACGLGAEPVEPGRPKADAP